MKYLNTFLTLGLVKNEAIIYETLLTHGVLGVSTISEKANIHRRNVYDTLNRLVEKGLVFMIVSDKENTYTAVDPAKLRETIAEKEKGLDEIMPDLTKLYHSHPTNEMVYILKGVEGWKQYMRDILRLKSDVFTIGAKGGWSKAFLGNFYPSFTTQAEELGINFYILYDAEAKARSSVKELPSIHRFMPKNYSSNAAVDIFGNHVVTITHGAEDPNFSDYGTITVIVNQTVADAYHKWWQFMWDRCKPKG